MAEDQVAVVIANCARAMIQAMGMQAENQVRIAAGAAIAYTEEEFLKVIAGNDLEYNSVITTLRT